MEVAGLVFGVLGALEICIKVGKDINSLVRQYKNAGLDFEGANQRLGIYNAKFQGWVKFWRIEKDTSNTTFHALWGPTGTYAIITRLERLEILCAQATKSQDKYKRALMSKQHKIHQFRMRVKYTFTGRGVVEQDLDKFEREYDLVEKEAKEFFERWNQHAAAGPTLGLGAMITGLVKESAVMDRAAKTQETTMHLFDGLGVKNLHLEIDISLQSDFVSRIQFRDFEFDTQKLHAKSTKLPIIVNTTPPCLTPPHQPPISPSVFILEAGEKCSFESQAEGLREETFDTIALLNSRNTNSKTNPNESFSLKCSQNEEYRFLVHTTGAGASVSGSRPLNDLFDNRPRRPDKYPSRTAFSITWQLDLAYTLATSVLNLQGSGWLNSLQSGNIYQRGSSSRKQLIHTLRVCGFDTDNNDDISGRTPLDAVLYRPVNPYDLKPEIFLLGVILLEIGLARSSSAILGDLEGLGTAEEKLARITHHLDNTVCASYTDITRTCLEGKFDFDDDMNPETTLRSYIIKVVEPLRKLREAISGCPSSRNMGRTSAPLKPKKPEALKEMIFSPQGKREFDSKIVPGLFKSVPSEEASYFSRKDPESTHVMENDGVRWKRVSTWDSDLYEVAPDHKGDSKWHR